ncbi:MAG: adenosylmethionine--8-amino-7-oxononanoate transaminase [Polyangiaceae bacterium UTPRO1]|jgi:adenosylmethionine-8-amino-7-oxononanoate aminotransferase|nr:adenosylmethionine--8-amino-7-oxononanoate transaminase [Myxococcales bacterium]OQY65797.1 MAG: adenosylmethionine--8-amino-7-oxononanoate transaminase [Polyangiaceae bacterium UTPRO1]
MHEPRPSDIVALDHAHLWHPFTQMQEWLAADPLVISAAEGNYLIGADGRRYLDGVSSLWCNVHGHRHPAIDAAIRDQLHRVAHTTLLGLASPPAALVAARLAALAPAGLTRTFYSDAGATAVEIALKLALQYWRLRGEDRPGFVALVEAYHGDTLGAMSIGFSETFHRFYRPLLPVERVPAPYALQRLEARPESEALAIALERLDETLRRKRGTIAAVVLEPLMQGAAGMWPQPVEYLREVRALTQRHETLLVCDEVATGFGRTGRLFACDHTATSPDLLVLGKGLTGGYLPLAATLATEEIFRAFLGPYDGYTAFFHGHTFTGNALACAAALASLQLFTPAMLAAIPAKAAALAAALAAAVRPLPSVFEIRQQGLMVGIELMRDPQRRTGFAPAERIGHRVILAARRRGVVLRPLGDVLVLMPPLSIGDDEIATLVAVAAESIAEVTGA